MHRRFNADYINRAQWGDGRRLKFSAAPGPDHFPMAVIVSGKSVGTHVDPPDGATGRPVIKDEIMKAVKSIIAPLAIYGAAFVTSAHAQLVHLSFKDSVGLFTFRSDPASLVWNLTTGNISQFDLFYDPAADLSMPLDPSRNISRALVTSPLGNFEITLPIQTITQSDDRLEFQYAAYAPLVYGLMDFSVQYTVSHSDTSLPVPPIDLGEADLYLSGGADLFGIPHLAEAYGYAGFNSATSENASTVDFTPVPEPSTYALGGVAVLGLALWKRHGGRKSRLNGPLVFSS